MTPSRFALVLVAASAAASVAFAGPGDDHEHAPGGVTPWGAVATVADDSDFGRLAATEAFRFDGAVPSPEQFLGYRIGQHFTRHGDLQGYIRSLAQASDRVVLEDYGLTNQRRALSILTITSPANHERLDAILAANARLTDPALDPAEAKRIVESNPAIVWFSYNVHGNEPSGTECAIQLAYTMGAARNDAIQRMLDDVVLVIDPLLNPDGHERYVSWYQNTRGAKPLANPDAAEHREPWPGGRTNHYLFDLNRDWLWLVQVESQQRLPLYRRYMPQLHVDFHEQGYTSPFFFGAGDEPYHANIPAETRDWVERYGSANADAFDEQGLVYSTRERFDYLYPGYGKVLPVYHGAVGMLAEKGGHSRAGLAIDVNDVYTLTLGERAYHHFVLSLSNLQKTVDGRAEQLDRFHRFFDNTAFARAHDAKAFVIDPGSDPALLERVHALCTAHGIRIDVLDEAGVRGDLHDYRDGEPLGSTALAAGSWIIDVRQPMGRLAATLFERYSPVSDPDTYDITAWSLPVAFGLDASYATAVVDEATTPLPAWTAPQSVATGPDDGVALIVDAAPHVYPRAIALAARHGIAARSAGEAFTIDEREFAKGSLIAHRIRNDPDAMGAFTKDLLAAGLSVHRATSGMTDDGPVLGADANKRLIVPKPILLRGQSTSSLSFGQIWHLFDSVSPAPYTPVNDTALSGIDLDAYNLLIIPDGGSGLAERLGEKTIEDVKRWVNDGGTLLALGGTAAWASRTLLGLEIEEPEDERRPTSELSWEERRDRHVHDRVPGVMLSATIDGTHPLSAGMDDWVGIIKRNARVLPVGDNGSVVARFDEAPVVGGVISDDNANLVGGSPYVTHHRLGSGSVICFSDDPTFRGFQHEGMRLFLNAVMLGPSL